jgi:MFS family permease
MADPRATRILVWMCVLIAVNQLGFGAIVPVVALYARSFGVLQSAIGLAIGVYGLSRVLVAVPVGKLTDVLGRRAALALGGLVTAAGNVLCAYAPNFATFVAARSIRACSCSPSASARIRAGCSPSATASRRPSSSTPWPAPSRRSWRGCAFPTRDCPM